MPAVSLRSTCLTQSHVWRAQNAKHTYPAEETLILHASWVQGWSQCQKGLFSERAKSATAGSPKGPPLS